MTQLTLDDYRYRRDICANRHGGNANSVAANMRVNKQRDREVIFQLIKDSGLSGVTMKDACAALNKLPNEISGRFSELKKAGLVYVNGSREGCGVHFAKTIGRHVFGVMELTDF